jgi:crotonobetainyl-CoA:carnitine CoA-transferase CaiB-like acyl-CoA transferase
MEEVWAHEQLESRGRWTTVGTPTGDVPALLPPGIAHVEAMQLGAVPALGQHTEALLLELGYMPEMIRDLRNAAVV